MGRCEILVHRRASYLVSHDGRDPSGRRNMLGSTQESVKHIV